MTKELRNLMIENGPLPKGTRIKTTQGGMHTGETHELADHLLESANRIMPNNLRFWMNGWYDLHDDIILPANVQGDGSPSQNSNEAPR